MNRIEADNEYITINVTPNESYSKKSFDEDTIIHEITFSSEKAAKEAMDMLAEALCDKQLS